jgi:hypothetical protein
MVKDIFFIGNKRKDRSPRKLGIEIPRMVAPELDHLTWGTQALYQSK